MAARISSPKQCHALKRYLLHFAHEHLDFRVQEIKSIISLLGCKALLKEELIQKGSPFLEIYLTSEQDAKAIMGRSILTRSLYELWAEGTSLADIQNDIKQIPSTALDPFTNEDSSFRIRVESFNKKISSTDKLSRIEALMSLDSVFRGKINLSTPDHSFHLLEYYPCETNAPKSVSAPLQLYFGRWIANGQREYIQQYHLQKRHFIANTSMDACLSMIMSNYAQVKKDDLVFDPFVGSGSLLVASAHYGAYVMGTDIDYLLLHGKAKPSRAKQKTRLHDESVRSNLRQYGLENKYLDVLVADASRHRLWREDLRFDAIITDPPYGIREAANKIASKDTSQIEDLELPEGCIHYPQKEQYQLSDIFKDLLNFAAKYLSLGGRLVYWLPIYTADYKESNIPWHPCLNLEANCEQTLSTSVSRRLITMVKCKEYEGLPDSVTEASVDVDHYDGASFRQKYFKFVKSNGEAQEAGNRS